MTLASHCVSNGEVCSPSRGGSPVWAWVSVSEECWSVPEVWRILCVVTWLPVIRKFDDLVHCLLLVIKANLWVPVKPVVVCPSVDFLLLNWLYCCCLNSSLCVGRGYPATCLLVKLLLRSSYCLITSANDGLVTVHYYGLITASGTFPPVESISSTRNCLWITYNVFCMNYSLCVGVTLQKVC